MYKALVSFSGLVSMTVGEVAEISDPSIVKDLLRAGYIEEVKTKEEPKKAEKPKVEKVEPKPRKKRTPKGG